MTFFNQSRTCLEQFRSGDESVLRDVYFAYMKDVELFVASGWFNPKTRSRMGQILDFDIRAELIQETFLRAFSTSARAAYDGIRPYKLYLLTIAKNVIVDYLRRRPKDSLSHVSVELDDLENHGYFAENDDALRTDPAMDEMELDWQRCIKDTRAFVQTLDGLQQRFISLRFVDEMPLLEVARTLSISRGRARFLEKDLGRRLKKHFQSSKHLDFLKTGGFLQPKQNGTAY